MTQLYWIFFAMVIAGSIIEIQRMDLSVDYKVALTQFSTNWTYGFLSWTVIWNLPLFALTYKYRNDTYITAQRIRLFIAAHHWMTLYMLLLSTFLFVAAVTAPNPSASHFSLITIMTLAGLAVGVFMFMGIAMSGMSRKFIHKYGIPRVVNVLTDFQNVPQLLRPRTAGPLFGELYRLLRSILSKGYPRLNFERLNEDVSNIFMAINIGTEDERKAALSFLKRLDELVAVGKRKPLETSNQLIVEMDSFRTQMSRLSDIAHRASISSSWNRGWTLSILRFLDPYSNMIIILIGIGSLILLIFSIYIGLLIR